MKLSEQNEQKLHVSSCVFTVSPSSSSVSAKRQTGRNWCEFSSHQDGSLNYKSLRVASTLVKLLSGVRRSRQRLICLKPNMKERRHKFSELAR